MSPMQDGRTDNKGEEIDVDQKYPHSTRVWMCIFVQEGDAVDGNLLHLTTPVAMGQAARERASLH